MVSLLGYNEGDTWGDSDLLTLMLMDTEPIYSFGEWMKRRRKQLRLTQREVAGSAHCSVAMVKKIEADERQPSAELAELLAEALQVPLELRAQFKETARGLRPVDQLPLGRPAANFPEVGHVAQPESLPIALPQGATPFIGREAELAEISRLLSRSDCRVLTLLGPGGIGKTRLAMESAFRLEVDFDAGSGFVPLADVTGSDEIYAAVAKTLHISLVGTDTPEAQLQRFLAKREFLLLLDNFEHLTAGAPMLAGLLAAAPRLKLLVTSRERLNLAGEWIFTVPGFEPEPAAELFAQQASRINPGFKAEDHAEIIDQICRMVGGHPLAVELAASWARIMSPEQIAAQISQDIDFLAGGPQDMPSRHQSLRALFDHSWALLSPEERDVFALLSILRGGFALEQARLIAGASWPLLLGLANKSLIEVISAERFDLHALTRQYAADKLAEMGETEALRQRHFEVYGRLARELAEQRVGPRAIVTIDRFEQELDNFHAALAWGLAQGYSEELLVFTEYMFFGWLGGGYWREGEKWTRLAVDRLGDEDNAFLCSGLCRLATFMAIQGRYMEAMPLSQRAIPMARRLDEPWPLAISNNLLGQSSVEMEESVAAYEELIDICQAHDYYPYNHFFGDALRLYGDRLMKFGYYAEAETYTRQSLSQLRAMGDVLTIAYPLGNLGRLALLDGRLQEAYELIAESARFTRRGGNRVGMGDWLFRLGVVQFFRGDLEAAEADLQEAAALYEEIGNPRGRADVMANLAGVALEQGDLPLAAANIQDCFLYYQQLYGSLQGLFDDYGFAAFDDVLQDLLYAGLLKAAQGTYEEGAMIFTAVAALQKMYRQRPLQPLQEKVEEAQAIIQEQLSENEWLAARARGLQVNLDELLALILA